MRSFYQNSIFSRILNRIRSNKKVRIQKSELNKAFRGPESFWSFEEKEIKISFKVRVPKVHIKKLKFPHQILNFRKLFESLPSFNFKRHLYSFKNLFSGIKLPALQFNLNKLTLTGIVIVFTVTAYALLHKSESIISLDKTQSTENTTPIDTTKVAPAKTIEKVHKPAKDSTSQFSDLNDSEAIDAEIEEIQQNPSDSEQTATILKDFTMPSSGVIADVTNKVFYLVSKKNNSWKTIKTFKMARGQNEGDKSVEGDKKTPIGEYFIHDIEAGERIGSLYGALIFKLDYPNLEDLNQNKTGSGIWIHGVEIGSPPTFTKGCVALSNQDVIQLIPYLKLGSPVKILKSYENQNLDSLFDEKRNKEKFEYFKNRYRGRLAEAQTFEDEFLQAQQFAERELKVASGESFIRAGEKLSEMAQNLVLEWGKAWASKDADRYGKLYAKDFVDQSGRKFDEFIERKRSIFNSNDSITVELSDFKIYHKGADTLKVSLFQNYSGYKNGTPLNVQRRKNITLGKTESGWKITGEK